MTDRIRYLKTVTKKETEDIVIYRELSQQDYADRTGVKEIFRKSHFLWAFAQKIPVVIDINELIVGSMRFWRSGAGGRNMGHIIVDYRMILKEGIPGIREKIAGLQTEDARAFDQAMEAFALFVGRYAREAARLGMTDVADNCGKLLRQAPGSFYEALQLVWFVHLFLHAEGMAPAVSFGRFDDYLYPFYWNDIAAGVLSRERAGELLMCFWLKTCEGDESQNLTLGGDIENDLTILCMEVTSALKVQQPSVSVRIGDTSSELLWARTLELIKCRTGMPAIFNDNIIIKALENANVESADARNYAIVGCYEANSDGNTFGTTANAGYFFLHQVLLEYMDSASVCETFSDFYLGFKAFFAEKYNTDILHGLRQNWENIRNHCVSPFQSACMGDCLKNGVPAELGGCKYTMAGINILGIGTLVDSIYAIKKIVFEGQNRTYRDFADQVKNNFPDKALAHKCRNLDGKYGTDNEETNQLAADLSNFIADLVAGGHIYEGVIPYAGLFVFLGDVYSDGHPSTPDGRLRGERISYGIGASDICTGKTVTSVLNSASYIANDRFADGNPLMFNISEKEVVGERGDLLLRTLIKGYFEKGGFHLQFNVTDAEKLRRAKDNPQDYSDLVVRISGYSEYFNRLNDAVKTALIERS